MSACVRMLPFAKTGTETAFFTARTFAQSAKPYNLHLDASQGKIKRAYTQYSGRVARASGRGM
jgi:hypothetical protein